ncbi:MAG: BrnT family toxin [Acidobacteria bacterium]|nr:MAG: BrnT family toxin [Acidobacteriota bacterium]
MRPINYTWDEVKAVRNRRLHRIAFEDAIKIFDGPTLERLDTRFDYPEDRWYAIGLVEGRPVTVIYTVLNEPFRRIISAWKAEKHEQKAYFDYFEPED